MDNPFRATLDFRASWNPSYPPTLHKKFTPQHCNLAASEPSAIGGRCCVPNIFLISEFGVAPGFIPSLRSGVAPRSISTLVENTRSDMLFTFRSIDLSLRLFGLSLNNKKTQLALKIQDPLASISLKEEEKMQLALKIQHPSALIS